MNHQYNICMFFSVYWHWKMKYEYFGETKQVGCEKMEVIDVKNILYYII